MLKPVLIFHLVSRAVVVTGLVLASIWSGRPFPEVMTRWDGEWYKKVAEQGYPSPLPVHPTGRYESSTAAFFPLYPLLTKGLTGLGMPFWLSGMVINLVASTAAVLIIVLVGTQYLDRRPAQLLGCLWTAFPVSAVLTTTYTEAVFTALGAGALLLALRRRWVLAGLLAALAGAVRAPGIVFAGAVGLAALEAILRRREWRALAGAVVAPLGFLAAIGYIGLRTGAADAWRLTERDGWHTSLNFGAEWVNFLTPRTTNQHDLVHLGMGLMAIGLIVLMIIAIIRRPPVPIIGLLIVGAFTAFGFGGVMMNAAPRVMMSFFPVLAPLAVLMARWRTPVQWLLLSVAAVIAAVLGGYFFAFAPLPV
ncbi:hypothetical protein [Microlunatus sp. Gsoil 973]|uniref:hypothetical protein n=1 Tax=Microlunatus sp. Gsoil 973 TaxID=2672569 RepID=UPI0012B4912F|nr:hypothetical protein [Microlunatus sp. Gsoil 973]QGN32892.1 hypothetical protein GJV80_08815 [Microlunatus sp. Gsoil 973]